MGAGEEKTRDGISKQRLAGAVAAGLGAYLVVRVFQKTGGDILRGLPSVANALLQFLIPQAPDQPVGGWVEPEDLLALEPFAIGIGLVTGGMVLAGQNPGEILKGIGEIIPL